MNWNRRDAVSTLEELGFLLVSTTVPLSQPSKGNHSPSSLGSLALLACTRQRHRRTYHMTMFGKEDLEGEVGIRIGGLRDAERAWDRTFTGTGHSQDLLPLELRHQPPSCLEINAKGLDEFLGNGHALLATGGHE